MKISQEGLILVALLAVPGGAHAGEFSLDVNGWSRHSNDTYKYQGKRHEYNEQNTGLGLTYGISKHFEASTGFYENSYYRTSVYGAVMIKRNIYLDGGFIVTHGIQIGLATGYADTPAHAAYFQFVAMPVVRLAYRRTGVTIGYIPRVNQDNGVPVSTIVVQANIRIGKP